MVKIEKFIIRLKDPDKTTWQFTGTGPYAEDVLNPLISFYDKEDEEWLYINKNEVYSIHSEKIEQ